ncbi:MAG TPA: deoxyribose-phosphate aldolase [Syntrophomonas sp.]|nr:deoxyribose-phosphate aldolase [Syntrophomonas sp.]
MELASYLDSTNLKPESTQKDIAALCEEAARYKMAAVCIQPFRLPQARRLLQGTGVGLCTVIGFPLGAEGKDSKVFSAVRALEDGAGELDMVINLGALKDGDLRRVEDEITGILKLKNEHAFILKVIVETALLTRDELIEMVRVTGGCGADFIKTSTGYSSRGASLEDVRIMNAHRPAGLKIKAAGGIRELDFALQLIEAGADRLGSSNTGRILEEYESRGGS